MRRDPRAYLWDARESALAIQSFTAGMDAASYAGNPMAQAAVERNSMTTGQAPDAAATSPEPITQS